jgi:hypothetical protein
LLAFLWDGLSLVPAKIKTSVNPRQKEDMTIVTQQYVRKPLYVDAVRVTAATFDEVVGWCQGEVKWEESVTTGTGKKYIHVRVHNPKNPRQTKAFIGDWILYTERGYKVYTAKAFHAAFDEVAGEETVSTNGNAQSVQEEELETVDEE